MATKKSSTKKDTKAAKPLKEEKKPAPKAEPAKVELTEEEKEALREKRALRILISSVFIIVLGIFSAICVYGGSGVGAFGAVLKNILRGLFGGGAYLFPVVLLASGVDMIMHARAGKVRATVIVYFIALYLFGALLHTFGPYCNAPLGEIYNIGIGTAASGGIISGFITALLYDSIGVWGLVLLYLAAVIACVIVVCYPSFEASLKNKDKPEEAVSEPEAPAKAAEPVIVPFTSYAPAPEPAFESEKKKKKERVLVREPKPAKKSKLEKLIDGDEQTPAEVAQVIPMPVEEEKEKVTHKDTQIAKAEISAEIAASEESSGKKPYIYPPFDLLNQDKQRSSGASDTDVVAERIINKLASFGISIRLVGCARGPAVTRFEFELAEGIKVSKIVGFADDIALAISASGNIRIEAPIPGKSAIGVEVPNSEIKTVYLRTLLESPEFASAKSSLSFAIGNDVSGANIVGDLAKMPHVLIAGATGSGKSVCINSLIISILYKSSPEDVRLIMVDPKMVELGIYNGIPHLLVPVVTDPKKASGTLSWAVGEMTKRYTTFQECGVKDIGGYNAFVQSHPGYTKMPRIAIIIDELADLMMVAKHEVEQSIVRLTQLARAAGMHLVIATQRPSVDVITGLIKANTPSRIAFTVSSLVDSRTILDEGGAEKLLGRGDMLYKPVGSKPTRVQGCFVSDKEVTAVVNFIKSHFEAEYDDNVSKQIEALAQQDTDKGKSGGNSVLEEDSDDPMLEQAIECVVDSGQASTSYLQRRLGLGYARAARLIDTMADRGIVGQFQGSKPRDVLITKEQFLEMKMRSDTSAPKAVESAQSSEVDTNE